MAAGGFGTLASFFPDRTVVTYDPRGLDRSRRKDGRADHSPAVRAGDVHAVIEALDAGPVDLFAGSGGAVAALALVAAHPGDVAVGEETLDVLTGRTAVATARLLGQEANVFPSHYGGFLGGEFGYAGQPEAFSHKLRAVLDDR